MCEGYENEIFGGSISFWLFHGSSCLSLGCTIIAGCTNEYQIKLSISSCQYRAVKNHVLLPCHVQRSWKQTSREAWCISGNYKCRNSFMPRRNTKVSLKSRLRCACIWFSCCASSVTCWKLASHSVVGRVSGLPICCPLVWRLLVILSLARLSLWS